MIYIVSLLSIVPLLGRERLLNGQRGFKRLLLLLDRETVIAVGVTIALGGIWVPGCPVAKERGQTPLLHPSIIATVNMRS